MLDRFELVFLLSLDDATQLHRLDTAHRNEAQRAQIIGADRCSNIRELIDGTTGVV